MAVTSRIPDDGPVPSTTPSHVSQRLHHPAVLAAAAAALGLVTGALVGAGVAWLVYVAATADCSPSDGWCELGAAAGGLVLGAAAAAIAYLTAGITLIYRHRSSGHRASPILTHIAIPLAVIAAIPIAAWLLP
jgi:hypothetical protein